jgi:hypothetical protein
VGCLGGETDRNLPAAAVALRPNRGCFSGTGQDTRGALFVVSVVVASHEHDRLRRDLEALERATGKGQRKWSRTRPAARLAYIRGALVIPALHRHLFADTYRNTWNYSVKTVLTVAHALARAGDDQTKATVFVDGLRRAQYHWFGVELRRLGMRTLTRYAAFGARRPTPSCGWPTRCADSCARRWREIRRSRCSLRMPSDTR